MKIGSAIKSIRKRLEISQSELAEKCDLSQTALSQIENDVKRPHPSTVARICEAMEVPQSILYVIAIEDTDVPTEKRSAYQYIYPSMKNLALQLVNADEEALVEAAI